MRFHRNDNTGSAGIFQLSTGFGAGTTGTEVKIGTSSSTIPQYNGAFDHSYITAATPTGNLYVCGNPGGNPTVYQVSVNAGVMGGAKAGPILSGTDPNTCSPVTDVYNAVVHRSGPTSGMDIHECAGGRIANSVRRFLVRHELQGHGVAALVPIQRRAGGSGQQLKYSGS